MKKLNEYLKPVGRGVVKKFARAAGVNGQAVVSHWLKVDHYYEHEGVVYKKVAEIDQDLCPVKVLEREKEKEAIEYGTKDDGGEKDNRLEQTEKWRYKKNNSTAYICGLVR